jgi:hypothetical protein
MFGNSSAVYAKKAQNFGPLCEHFCERPSQICPTINCSCPGGTPIRECQRDGDRTAHPQRGRHPVRLRAAGRLPGDLHLRGERTGAPHPPPQGKG